MGKNKAQAHHTSTYFRTRRVSIELGCLHNPAGFLACPSVPAITIIARAVSLPAVPGTTPAAQAAVVHGCVSMSTRRDPWGSGAVEIATRNGIIPGSVGPAQAHPLTKSPDRRKQPSAGLGVQLRSTLPIRALVLHLVYFILYVSLV